jgi:hypothetical protein
MFRLSLGLIVAILGGCTHQALTQSTVFTTGTVMEIQYRIVLMNLAMLSCHPEGLPSHIDLADGVIQINDEAGFGTSGGFTVFEGMPFGIERYGPSGSRQVTEQWGADATTDPQRLIELQELYRVALGLPPLPPPNAIAYLRSMPREEGPAENGSDQSEDSSDSPSATSTGGEGSTPSSGGGSSNGSNNRRIPIEVLLADVPAPGWFCVGRKRDVPKEALYVGRYRDCYAWVTADGVPSLARFTVTVLSVVKYDPGAGEAKSRGLAVTR